MRGLDFENRPLFSIRMGSFCCDDESCVLDQLRNRQKRTLGGERGNVHRDRCGRTLWEIFSVAL